MQSRDAGIPDSTSAAAQPRRQPPPPSPVAGRIGGAATAGAWGRDPVRPPALAAAPDVGALLKGLRRRWLAAFGLGLMMAGLVASAAWMLLAPKHTAFAQVRVAAAPDMIGGSGGGEDRTGFITYLLSQSKQLRGRTVLNAALIRDEVKKLNLEHKYPDPVLWLESELKVMTQPDSEWIDATLSCDDPEDAVTILNAVIKAYKLEVVEREKTLREENLTRARKLYTDASSTLRLKRGSLMRLIDELKLVDATDAPAAKIVHEALLREYDEVNRNHSQTAFQLTNARAHLKVLKEQESRLGEATLSEGEINQAVESDPRIKVDLDRVKQLKELIAAIEENQPDPHRDSRYGEARRRVKTVMADVEAARKEMRKELVARARLRGRADYDTRVALIRGEVAALEPQEFSLRKQAEELQEKAKKVGNVTVEYKALKDDVDHDTKAVEELARKKDEAALAVEARSRVSVPQEAALMARDIKKQALGTIFGGVVALAATCLAVGWWEFRRRRIRTPEEVSTGLGLRVVGSVPASPDVETLINVPPEEELEGHLVLESVDAIRTLVLHSDRHSATRVLMVTSAEGGEGKTTLACHLASSLSRAGRKTLLIDGDLRQPAVHQFFEAQPLPGFSEVLLGEVDTVDAILATNQDGLMILPAGQWDREVIQSLARGGAAAALEKLKEEFDFIVVDSHPVLSATDSLLIGQSVDAVILSVMREVSQTPRVYAAAQRLNGLGIRVLGAVINATDPDELYAAGHAYAAAA